MSINKFTYRHLAHLGAIALLGVMAAGASASAQRPPAPRPIGRVEHFTTDSLASAAAALQMPGGRVLVNDITGRRLLLFDSTLAHPVVVADTTDATANAYGTRAGTLIRYKGDSALYIDIGSLSMLVIDPAGKIVRVLAVPRPDEAQMLIGSVFGTPGFDAKGRLVYYNSTGLEGTFMLCCVGTSRPQMIGQHPGIVPKPDSGMVVRVDLATHAFDTLAFIRIANTKQILHVDADGYLQSIESQRNPIPIVDSWTVMPDGAVAIVRGRDYHVDWLDASGHWTSSPKMPFDWQRVDETRKLALIDSTVRAEEARNAEFAKRRAEMNAAPAAAGGGSGGRGSGRGGGRGGGGRGGIPIPEIVGHIDASALPDYIPPFTRGAVEPDADGHLWIKTSALVDGRPVYDVVNREGVLIDRVVLPPYRSIAGFGPGVAYLAVKDPSAVVHLERVRIK
ncbi:MAG TPA: hypothetical protein VN651_04030 [Gemmatimonadaceae bacterium]|nr:hypothetical protein [Gemmatimonadaceae bacterium]